MAIPSLLSMAVDGSTLALYFSEPIKAVLPSRNRFQVFVNGVRNFTSADATLTNGDTIRLALTTPIPAGATVTVSYLSVNGFDRVGYGDIRSTSTNQTAAFFRTRVTSNLTGTPAASVAISSSTASLRVGESATITFSFSRNPGSSFSSGDISLSGGTLSALSGSGLTRTAVFTPTAGSSGTASITVGAAIYTDIFGNSGSAGITPALSYDTLAPTLAITSSSAALIAGQTATITFTFSEDPGSTFTWNGTTGDVVVTGGTLGAISGTGLTRTATFTPTADASGIASITVAAGSYTDTAGNNGGAGFSPSIPFDTLAPTVSSVVNPASAQYVLAGGTLSLTLNFSETVKLSNAGTATITAIVDLAAGGPANVTLTATGTTTTAAGVSQLIFSNNSLPTTLTDTNGVLVTANSLSIISGTFTDNLGNSVSSTFSQLSATNQLVDTVVPTLSITTPISTDGYLNNAEDESSLIISGTSSGADGRTVTVVVGSITGQTSTIATGGAWSITLTSAQVKTLTQGTVNITANVSDTAGNPATQATASFIYDITDPTLSITTPISTDGYLNNAEDESSLIISGTSSGADGRTVTVVVGSITGQTSTIATGGAWSITLTSAQVKTLTQGTVNITANVSDTAGNPATQATASFVYDITVPTLAITSLPATVLPGDTAVITFTFSETPAGFTASDIITSGGSITGLAAPADPKVYTATFNADNTGTASLSVAAGSYTDLAGNDGGASFYVAADTLAISSLGSGDVLAVAEGATANAEISAIGFTATSQTSNAGTATLTSMGYAVNLANATGPNGYAVTNTGAATTLIGSAFTDTLTGGAGDDTLVGGAGDDTYTVDSTTDTITEDLDAGTDTIESSVTFSLAAIANVENLTLTGSSAIDGTGNALNNVITGNAGNNSLNGGAGTDTLIGGAGNDIYSVDSTTDTITEASNAGTDTIQSSVTFSLAAIANVENLTLTGSSAIGGTGNALNNVITGNGGSNTLNGGAGTDTLVGGAGNDIYSVDSTTDTITEASNAGTDTIQSSVTFSLAAIANVENLTLTGSSAIGGTGNALNNVITGNGGSNTLTGGDGNDTLNGGGGTDTLSGGGGTDTLSGDTGNDTLTGGSGNDNLTGGASDDTFNVDAGTDTITDLGNGSDVLKVSSGGTASATAIDIFTATFATSNGGTATLSSNYNVNLSNAGSAMGTNGYSVTNTSIVGRTIIGSQFNDTLTGNIGADILTGGNGIDTLTGLAGADTFNYSSPLDACISGTTSPSFERITDLAIGTDGFDGPNAVLAANVQQLGDVGSSLTSYSITALLTTTNFLASGASTFTFDSGAGLRTFIALNDATAGYSSTLDGIIEITGYTGTLTSLAII